MSAEEICKQRKLFMNFNVPGSRLTVSCPYDGKITQEQLNMRRKVEILKYNKNASTSGRLTQKQQFAKLSSPNYNANRVSCTQDKFRPVLTTSSGIPGPPIFLFEDPNVPLYKYATNTNAGAITLKEDDTQWIVSIEIDVTNLENIETLFTRLIIKKAIDQAALTYNVQVPVSYHLSGNNIFTDTSGTIINVSNITSTLQMKYNDGIANSIVGTVPSNEFKVLLRPEQNITTVGNDSTYNFSASIFAGYIDYNKLLVYTSPGNVYTFNNLLVTTKKLDLRTNAVEYTKTSQTNILNEIVFNIKLNANANTTFLKTEENCIITSPTSHSSLPHVYSISDSTGLINSEILNKSSINVPNVSVSNLVRVANGTNYFGVGNIFYINDSISDISVVRGFTYLFNQSDTTNSGHVLAFSTTPNGTHGGGTEYVNNVLYVGTPGEEYSYTLIKIDEWTTLPLYIYCKNHPNMGLPLVL
tara:strand:- start:3651 stop:5063 length:1413 start_codon:yes stop_codon:yes gene_type:complete